MAFAEIKEHEDALSRSFVVGLGRLPKVNLFGVPEVNDDRGPTFAISIDGREPGAVAAHLASRGVYVWSGHYYAVNVMRQLAVLDQGGLVRVGFVHYNTETEVNRALEALAEV
jgi:selenocysteine lyase/cysteine desulfurase